MSCGEPSPLFKLWEAVKIISPNPQQPWLLPSSSLIKPAPPLSANWCSSIPFGMNFELAFSFGPTELATTSHWVFRRSPTTIFNVPFVLNGVWSNTEKKSWEKSQLCSNDYFGILLFRFLIKLKPLTTRQELIWKCLIRDMHIIVRKDLKAIFARANSNKNPLGNYELCTRI